MIDILDVVLAKKKSFTGETESLVRQAREAMAQANEVAAILEDAQAANSAAQAANEAAQAAEERASEIAADFEELKSDFTSAAEDLTNEIVDEKIQQALTPIQTSITELEDTIGNNYEELNTTINEVQTLAENAVDVTIEDTNTTAAKIKKAKISKNNQSPVLYEVEKNYTSAGNNEDGSMTQKAIKEYVESIKSEIETNIQNSLSNLDLTNKKFAINEAGNIVVIGEDGTPISGSTSEIDIITLLVNAGLYNINDTVGLQIDYNNKTFSRVQDAIGKNAGEDFNSYSMYGGRMRCNVLDDGTITAFYGDSNYKDDGSNGQVMVYQPKFYYQRIPMSLFKLKVGNIIIKEILILSGKEKAGFKIHPLFINEEGEVVDYVLLPAYQGSIYDNSNQAYDLTSTLIIDPLNDKLSSVADAKPISGDINEFNIDIAEKLAKNRGEGWHITNMAAESANQMLLMVEFGHLNGQNALEDGIVNLPNAIEGKNCASLTGSTKSLGNNTGVALSTTSSINGTITDCNLPGERAISYRGMENPWGNIWHFVGGINIKDEGQNAGGQPYICKNFNYNLNEITENYEPIGFLLPATHSWISAMGYGDSRYDWIYMPGECRSANSLLPVGDNLWTSSNFNNINCTTLGGTWASEASAGPFYYGCDCPTSESSHSFGANIMFIPKKNTIYTSNCVKWANKFGGD